MRGTSGSYVGVRNVQQENVLVKPLLFNLVVQRNIENIFWGFFGGLKKSFHENII